MAISPVGLARYKRAAGLDLTEEERGLLRAYERRYDGCKAAFYVTPALRSKWEKLAKKRGLSFSEWVRDRVAESVAQRTEIQRLERLLKEANSAREQSQGEAVRQAQVAERLKVQLDDVQRDYSFLLRREVKA